MRAFDTSNKRISTAIALRDDSVLEVYPPPKKTHASFEVWKAQYPAAQRFEETVNPAKTTREARMRLLFSYPVKTDTPLQAMVRQIYTEYGVGKSTIAHHLGPVPIRTRAFTGVFVLRLDTQTIEPVYFNFERGTVMFSNKVVKDLSPDQCVFFSQPYPCAPMHKIVVVPETYEDPLVVLFINQYTPHHSKLVQKIHEAGYSILFCRHHAVSYHGVFAHTFPNVVSVVEERYDAAVCPISTQGHLGRSKPVEEWLEDIRRCERGEFNAAAAEWYHVSPLAAATEKKIESAPAPSTSTPT